ncbi:MAG: group II intron reverse transcriptase/maturase, partial [Pseudomonadota bacterium]|nr:group II intron reverse transcriptase/maturase [Pseudomonadota bacterium]
MLLSVQALQEKLSRAAKQSLDRRFGALYDKLYRSDVLQEAWARVRANKGAPGIDEHSIATIETVIGVDALLAEIGQELHAKTYRPLPVKRCWIDKPGKAEKRPLGIPVIKDRVVQMAAKLVMEPIFETNFLPCSYGFRPGRDATQAICEIQRVITFQGQTVVVDADIRSYLDRCSYYPPADLGSSKRSGMVSGSFIFSPLR